MIEVILWVGLVSVGIYLLILLYLTIGIIRTDTEVTDKQPSVSVIIAAHNEDLNITVCLDSILNQNYPQDKLEIIIVNDRSEDNTGLIIKKYERNHSNIHTITINECQDGLSPKKNALSQGIAIANGEIIATTDADCRASQQWIKLLSSFFTPETGMVVGIAPLKPTSWWLSPLICIDAIFGSLTAYGSLGWNNAVTCTGRNFAYRKDLFHEINGYSGIDHILMGDDDLLMMKARKKTEWKIRFMPDTQATVKSLAASGWRHYGSQRKRHISASRYFPFSVKLGFGLVYFSKFLIMLLLIFLLLQHHVYNLLFIMIILTYLLTFLLLTFISSRTDQKSVMILYPVWEIYYLLNHMLLGSQGLFGRIGWGKR